MIERCEFCGRSNYLNNHDTCNGCGAPIERKAVEFDGENRTATGAYIQAMMYSRAALGTIEYPFGPGQNIPIDMRRLGERSRLSDFIQGAASVGALMCRCR